MKCKKSGNHTMAYALLHIKAVSSTAYLQLQELPNSMLLPGMFVCVRVRVLCVCMCVCTCVLCVCGFCVCACVHVKCYE